MIAGKLLIWSFFLFVVSIPFGTKKFIFSFAEPISELNSVFLYASDIFLILFLVIFLFEVQPPNIGVIRRRLNLVKLNEVGCPKIVCGSLLLFLLFSAFSIFLAAYKIIAVYHFLRLVILVLGALAIAGILQRGIVSFEKIMVVLAGSAVFQALIGFLQFKFQRSIGLELLGESAGNVFTKGLGTIMAQGGILLRAYGTMSHANILAAFLVVGLIAFYHLYLRSDKFSYGRKIIISVAIFFTALGLVLTFSRSGWITAGVVTAFMLIWGLSNREYRRATLNLLVILSTCFLLLVTTFGWAIFPRAHLSMKDSSISDRYIFNLVGLEIMKSRPLGVGIGNELRYAIDNELYVKRGLLRTYSWQPIHNIYLLIGTEIGILGLLAFLAFVWRSAVGLRKSTEELGKITILSLLLFVLVFGLFDHFFWDLQSGRLLFWLVLGIMMGASPSTRLRASPRSVIG